MARSSDTIQDRIDRLSDLPDSILHHILSFMETDYSVQTCILSRRWRCLWKYVPVLFFIQCTFDDLKVQQQVEKVLSLRSDRSSINRVVICFLLQPNNHLLDMVMKYAASHGVQDVYICTVRHMRSLEVVRSVCYCYQSLKVLELNETNIRKKAVGMWSCLQLLESLTLTNCRFVFRDAAHDAFANLPRLETLKLDSCFHVGATETSVLKVTGPKLLNLEINVPGINSLEIVAPKLQSFSYEIDPFCTPIFPDVSKSNLPSLNRANIKLLNWHEFLDICSSSDNDYTKQMLLDRCASLFKILHNVRALDLLVETFELLVEVCNLVNRQASPFQRMKSLSLKHSEESVGVVPDQVISYFLGGSPNEEDKHFTMEYVCLTGTPFVSDYPDSDKSS
ncbi:Putative F-box/LRR-repeat protein At5g02930 [Linum perenne]